MEVAIRFSQAWLHNPLTTQAWHLECGHTKRKDSWLPPPADFQTRQLASPITISVVRSPAGAWGSWTLPGIRLMSRVALWFSTHLWARVALCQESLGPGIPHQAKLSVTIPQDY